MPVAHIHFMYDLVQGDLQEAKRKLADEVAESIARNVVHHHQGSPKDLVTVVFHDIGADDWAAGGKLFSDRTDGHEADPGTGARSTGIDAKLSEPTELAARLSGPP